MALVLEMKKVSHTGTKGTRGLLTIFDYLKYRARQSVIDGVQEAVESLEKEKVLPESPATASGANKTPLLFAEKSTGDGNNNHSDKAAADKARAEADGDLPPRRRGRPKKQQG